jgi:autotransporter translocation and assembly factor TamB
MDDTKTRVPWLRYFLGSLLILLLLFIIFYQPILFGLVKLAAREIAKSQALSLQFKIHGTVFSDIVIEDLHLRPLKENTQLPLERLDLGRFGARYNLLSLPKKDFLNLIELVELKDVVAIVRPVPGAPPPKSGPIRFTPIIPKKIDIRNVNVTVRQATGDIDLKNLAVAFQQGKQGYLTVDRLNVPGVADWKNIHAGLDYEQNRIRLSHLALDPLVKIDQFLVDLNGAEEGSFRVDLNAKALDAPVSANASVQQKGGTALLDSALSVSDLHLDQIKKFAVVPLTGTIPTISAQLRGDLKNLQTLDGQINVDTSKLSYQTYGIDRSKVAITIDKGRGQVKEISAHAGQNHLWINGDFSLPNSPNDLITNVAATLGFAATVPDPAFFLPGLNANSLTTGTVSVAQGRLSSVMQTSITGIRGFVQGLQLPVLDAAHFVSVRIPMSTQLWPSIAMIALTGLRNITYQDAHIDSVQSEAHLMNSEVAAFGALVRSGDSRIEVNSDARLPSPGSNFDLRTTNARVQFNIAKIADFIRQDLVSGELTANGDLKIRDLLPEGFIRASGREVKYRGLVVQTVDLDTRFADGKANVQTCHLTFDPKNSIDVHGSATLKDPYPYETSGNVELKDLGVFNSFVQSVGQPTGLSGSVQANWSGKGDSKKPIPVASVRAGANEIKYRGLTIKTVDIDANTSEDKVLLPTFKVVFDQNNYITGQGNTLLKDPYTCDASANVQFADLKFLNELIKSFGQDLGLGGKLNLTWSGKGPLKEQVGTLQIHGDGLRTKTVQGIKVDISGDYRGLNGQLSQAEIRSPYADLSTTVRLSPELLEIPSLTVRKNQDVITGNAKVPLNLASGAKTAVDLDKPLEASFHSDRINLATLQSQQQPQVTGTVAFDIRASKTLRDPLIEMTTTVRDVRSRIASSFAAASADLAIRLADKVFTIDGKVQQPDIQPLQLQGKMPLDTGNLVSGGKVPDDTPLQFLLKWPETNLAFLKRLSPEIRILEGKAHADVSVGGTLKKPALAGDIGANLPRFQARTDTVPPLSNVVAHILLQQNRVQLEQIKGEAGGGPFNASGGVDLTDGANPKLDISANGKQVLLTRSDNIIVRSNFNLAIRGPLSAGEVSGNVGLTSSKFFKDIDLLPLNLPGRPPPQPPSAPPKVSIDTPPLKDWKFNIKIKTDDAFLVQSNLARGGVLVDLQLGGTGAKPILQGTTLVEHLVVSLPFARMHIDNGYITFDPGGNPLDPTLNIVGRARTRDYDVRARIFGRVSNNTVLLDSTPPLEQGDILVLLATGSVPSEFGKDPTLLAGRATFIVIQQLLGKFFPQTGRADENTEPFIDRFDVQILPGRKVGDQSISTSFRLTDKWQIIGDIGSGGDYRGRLKYLVRFR